MKKLNAYYMLEGIQPVISVAQNAIKDILNETQPVPVTIDTKEFIETIERASLIITERLKNPLRISFTAVLSLIHISCTWSGSPSSWAGRPTF